jgi:Cu/Ag efflux protein CusF
MRRRRLIAALSQRPAGVIGLTVPGMPIGSPGMDGPAYGNRRDRYDVVLLHEDGRRTVFATHRRPGRLMMKRMATLATALLLAAAALANETDGEVRKIDKAQARITLKHGEIKNLDMPPMTMVFRVKDAKLLDAVAVGDKVRFAAEKSTDGNFVVTQIVKAP